ncbi:hypothetical protein [Streptomyces chrestomyceticus]|uniref:hypothetical protein n=1 Tax=Streptomyces chrestomyceticus TaxID=68185 RepID=UPI0033C5533A
MTTDHAGTTAGILITNAFTTQGHQPYTRTDSGGSCVAVPVPGTPDELWICGEGGGREATVEYAPAEHEALVLRLAPGGDETAPGARELTYCQSGNLTVDIADVIAAANHHIANPRMWEVHEQTCTESVTTKFDAAETGARAESQAAAHYTARRPDYLRPCPACPGHTITLISLDAGAEHVIDRAGRPQS